MDACILNRLFGVCSVMYVNAILTYGMRSVFCQVFPVLHVLRAYTCRQNKSSNNSRITAQTRNHLGSRIRQLSDFGFVSLDIIGVIPEDAGEYTLRVVNAVAEVITQCIVEIEGRLF